MTLRREISFMTQILERYVPECRQSRLGPGLGSWTGRSRSRPDGCDDPGMGSPALVRRAVGRCLQRLPARRLDDVGVPQAGHRHGDGQAADEPRPRAARRPANRRCGGVLCVPRVPSPAGVHVSRGGRMARQRGEREVTGRLGDRGSGRAGRQRRPGRKGCRSGGLRSSAARTSSRSRVSRDSVTASRPWPWGEHRPVRLAVGRLGRVVRPAGSSRDCYQARPVASGAVTGT